MECNGPIISQQMLAPCYKRATEVLDCFCTQLDDATYKIRSLTKNLKLTINELNKLENKLTN